MNIHTKVSNQKGFTLIELLVVIAIIGLLAAVVLASLNSARAKGADAAIKADLRNVQSQAAIVYDDAAPNSYTLVCTNATVIAALTHAQNAAGAGSINYALTSAGTSAMGVCHSTSANFAIDVPLKSNNANSWCVDDAGNAKQITGYLAANAVVCP